MRIREIAIATLMASACGSPTADTCVNGRDQLGRGPTVVLTTQCSPVGSDLTCVGKVDQGGYCANTSPITGKTQWISLEPEVATFENPSATVGVLRVLTAGVVELNFTFGGYGPSLPTAFAVATGAAPERMLMLNVVAYANSVSATSPRVSGAALDVRPDRGPEQSCQTSQSGACNFWVLSGNVQISARKDGYAPAQVASDLATLNSSFPNVSIVLMPLPSP